MPEKRSDDNALSMPITGMLIMGICGAVIVSACFVVIRYWPVPVSVAPYFGGRIALVWGAVVGSLVGLCVGYLVDDTNVA